MTRTDIFLAILQSAASFVPGGNDVKEGIEALVHRNADPNDDVGEIADAVTKVAVGVIQAVEGVKGQDYVNDAVFLQVVENIRSDIKLLQLVIVKKPASAGPKPASAALPALGKV